MPTSHPAFLQAGTNIRYPLLHNVTITANTLTPLACSHRASPAFIAAGRRRCAMTAGSATSPGVAAEEVGDGGGQLSTETIAVMKSLVPVLRARKNEIVLRFYAVLFELYPDVKPMFNIDRQAGGSLRDSQVPAQVAALGRTVLQFAQNIDNLSTLLPALRPIMHKHVARGVHEEHYPLVGDCLLRAMREVLGDDAVTEEVERAWKEAYAVLQDVFVEGEREVAEDLEEHAGYGGFVEARVVKVDDDGVEGGLIRVGVVPVGVGVPPVDKGQFVAVGVEVAGEGEGEGGLVRTMTSVKVEEGEGGLSMVMVVPKGEERAVKVLRGSAVGDVLKVSMPCGGEDAA